MYQITCARASTSCVVSGVNFSTSCRSNGLLNRYALSWCSCCESNSPLLLLLFLTELVAFSRQACPYSPDNSDRTVLNNYFSGMVWLLYIVFCYHYVATMLFNKDYGARDPRSEKGSHWIHVRTSFLSRFASTHKLVSSWRHWGKPVREEFRRCRS